MSGPWMNDHCGTCHNDAATHTWCQRVQQRNGIQYGGLVCAPCGHADARCERRAA